MCQRQPFYDCYCTIADGRGWRVRLVRTFTVEAIFFELKAIETGTLVTSLIVETPLGAVVPQHTSGTLIEVCSDR